MGMSEDGQKRGVGGGGGGGGGVKSKSEKGGQRGRWVVRQTGFQSNCHVMVVRQRREKIRGSG